VRKLNLVVALGCALAALAAGGANAAQVTDPCTGPVEDAGNGATACTVILRVENTDVTGSSSVIECFGEDFLVHVEAQAVAHWVYRPGDVFASLEHAAVTAHGTATGVVSGTQAVFNQQGSAVIDQLPNGGAVLHETAPAEVVTQGSSVNLVLLVELQQVIAPDGTLVNQTVNAQAKCGSSDHERVHDHQP
jgi:hypothetical protein